MKRVMLDIETVATVPTAAVIAVALAIRDETTKHVTGRTWYFDRNTIIGGVDPKTLEWWNQQDPRVRERIFGGTQSALECLKSIRNFYQANLLVYDGPIRIYAAPAMFDFPIMRNQFSLFDVECPWDWKDERCLSTMRRELEDQGIVLAEIPNENPHDPMSDCIQQFGELDDVLHHMEYVQGELR